MRPPEEQWAPLLFVMRWQPRAASGTMRFVGRIGWTWPKALMTAAAVVVVASLVVWFVANRGSGAEAARWRLDPSFTPAPGSTEIPVMVQEAACASGKPATGRIQVGVAYSGSAVTIDIRVQPLGGDQRCPGVETPYTVQLREPLGQRDLVDANARTP